MQDTLQNHKSIISIGGREISNLRFADDKDIIPFSNAELQEHTNILVEASNEYGMEVS